MSTRTLLPVVLSAVFSLAACSSMPSTPPPVKVVDITKDSRAYLSQNFAPTGLSPALHDPFTSPGPFPTFKELTFTYEVTQHDVNPAPNKANDVKHKEVSTLINAGNGFVESQTESSSNEIPYANYLTLTYANIFTIKSQSVVYSAVNAQAASVTDSMSNVSTDVLHPKDNSTYGFDEHAYSKDFSFKCQSGKSYAANTLLPKLSGSALDLDCSFTTEGVVSRRSKFTFLSAYGVYFPRETDTSVSSFLFKTVDVAAR